MASNRLGRAVRFSGEIDAKLQAKVEEVVFKLVIYLLLQENDKYLSGDKDWYVKFAKPGEGEAYNN